MFRGTASIIVLTQKNSHEIKVFRNSQKVFRHDLILHAYTELIN